MMPDGRIVGVGPQQGQSGSGPAQIHVVLNWSRRAEAPRANQVRSTPRHWRSAKA